MPFCSKCGKPVANGDLYCSNCGARIPADIGTAGSQPPGGATPTGARSGIDAIIKSAEAQSYWIRRIVAIIIDFIIVAIFIGLITLILLIPSIIIGSATGRLFTGILGFPGFTLLVGIIMIVYFPVFEATHGATFGKAMMRLRVTTVGGGRPTFEQAFIRNVSKIFWLLLLLDVVIGLAIEQDYKQKVSDRWAGTTVMLR